MRGMVRFVPRECGRAKEWLSNLGWLPQFEARYELAGPRYVYWRS